MPGILSDKVSLITGAGSGIGRASAIAFAREGAQVVVSDVNAEGGEETVSRISEIGGQAIFVPADVSRAGDVEDLVQSIVRQYGRLDCAFNNAGVSGGQVLLHEYSEVDWDRVIGINPSLIYGSLSANGQIFLVNPSGVYFGPNAQVNVHSLLATDARRYSSLEAILAGTVW